MFIRKVSFEFLAILLMALQASSQTAKRDCRGVGTIALNVAFDDSYSSATVVYQLSDTKKFSTAQIEVWDRPKLLFRTQVPIKTRGQIVWTPKEEPADTPLALWIRVDDPNLPRDTNDSGAMIGTTGRVETGVVPELVHQTIVLEEGAESPVVTSKAKNLGEHNTRMLLMEQESPQVWIAREYLPVSMADLEHVSVQIPSLYLLKPTVLQLEAVRVGDDSVRPVGSQVGGGFGFITIYVMDKSRPVFSTVEPSVVSANDQAGVTVRIMGSGFTAESQVLTSFQVGIGHDTSDLKPILISSHELQVTIPSYLLRTASSSPDEAFRLWVRNGDDQHVSDPQTFTLLPTPEFPLAGSKRPAITSVSPYPVPLMDYRSPAADLLLTIIGENFKDGDTVIAKNGELNGNGNLRTEFISPQQLNAWLPREMWRSHRLSFRLVTRSQSGSCAAEAWQDW